MKHVTEGTFFGEESKADIRSRRRKYVGADRYSCRLVKALVVAL